MKILIIVRSYDTSRNTIREVRAANDVFKSVDVRTLVYGEPLIGFRPDMIIVAAPPPTMAADEWLNHIHSHVRKAGCVWIEECR